MELMLEQSGVTGHVFNTVGSGVRGGGTPGYVTYGAAKRGLPQMTDSLVAELEGKTQGYNWPPSSPGQVKVHTLSPGMVFTDLLLKDSTPELRKFPFGVLAATPEEVAQDLVPKMLATTEAGTFVEYLTKPRTLLKFFNRFVRQQKSDVIDDDGNVIQKSGEKYNEDGVRALY
jgi:chlorophyll(ide) b reductase